MMRRTRHVVLPVRSWQYMGLMTVSLACLTLGLVSRDREGQAGSLAGPELQHGAPHEIDACPNDNPFNRMSSADDLVSEKLSTITNDGLNRMSSATRISRSRTEDSNVLDRSTRLSNERSRVHNTARLGKTKIDLRSRSRIDESRRIADIRSRSTDREAYNRDRRFARSDERRQFLSRSRNLEKSERTSQESDRATYLQRYRVNTNRRIARDVPDRRDERRVARLPTSINNDRLDRINRNTRSTELQIERRNVLDSRMSRDIATRRLSFGDTRSRLARSNDLDESRAQFTERREMDVNRKERSIESVRREYRERSVEASRRQSRRSVDRLDLQRTRSHLDEPRKDRFARENRMTKFSRTLESLQRTSNTVVRSRSMERRISDVRREEHSDLVTRDARREREVSTIRNVRRERSLPRIDDRRSERTERFIVERRFSSERRDSDSRRNSLVRERVRSLDRVSRDRNFVRRVRDLNDRSRTNIRHERDLDREVRNNLRRLGGVTDRQARINMGRVNNFETSRSGKDVRRVNDLDSRRSREDVRRVRDSNERQVRTDMRRVRSIEDRQTRIDFSHGADRNNRQARIDTRLGIDERRDIIVTRRINNETDRKIRINIRRSNAQNDRQRIDARRVNYLGRHQSRIDTRRVTGLDNSRASDQKDQLSRIDSRHVHNDRSRSNDRIQTVSNRKIVSPTTQRSKEITDQRTSVIRFKNLVRVTSKIDLLPTERSWVDTLRRNTRNILDNRQINIRSVTDRRNSNRIQDDRQGMLISRPRADRHSTERSWTDTLRRNNRNTQDNRQMNIRSVTDRRNSNRIQDDRQGMLISRSRADRHSTERSWADTLRRNNRNTQDNRQRNNRSLIDRRTSDRVQDSDRISRTLEKESRAREFYGKNTQEREERFLRRKVDESRSRYERYVIRGPERINYQEGSKTEAGFKIPEADIAVSTIYEILRQALVMALCVLYGASIYNGKGTLFGDIFRQTSRFLVW